MRRVVKITSLAALLVLAIAGATVVAVYRASQRVPEFYQAAVAVEPEAQEEGRKSFVARATALASDLHVEGRWQSLFTADEINAWLALELSTNYPDLLPVELRDPRVSIDKDKATLGCQYHSDEVDAVVSIKFDAYLHSPHVVAIRIQGAHAGAIPVPLGQILDGISHAARQLNLRLEWRQSHGDPVALITLPTISTKPKESLCLDAIELRDGELFVAGTVGRPPLETSPIVPEPLLVPTAKVETDDDDQPRIGAAPTETRQQ